MVDVRKSTILVVEDDASIREVLVLFLGMEKYKVLSSQNGQEAIDLLEHDMRPNLILLDMIMPILDGWEFLKRRAADSRLSAIPVISLSISHSIGKLEHIAAFVPKPMDLDKLLSTIRKFCPS